MARRWQDVHDGSRGQLCSQRQVLLRTISRIENHASWDGSIDEQWSESSAVESCGKCERAWTSDMEYTEKRNVRGRAREVAVVIMALLERF